MDDAPFESSPVDEGEDANAAPGFRPNQADDREEISAFAKKARRIVSACVQLLFVAFAWLQFRSEDFVPLIELLPASLLFKLALALCLVSWGYGLQFDIEIQEAAYDRPPNRGRLSKGAIALVVAVTALFAGMCWFAHHLAYGWFVLTLWGFFSADLVGWIFLTRRELTEVVRDTKERSLRLRDYYRYEEVRLVFDEYLAGTWKYPRFAVSAAWLLVLTALVALSGWESAVQSAVGLGPETFISSLILAYFLAMEAWIWIVRIYVRLTRDMLRRLRKSYRLEALANGGQSS